MTGRSIDMHSNPNQYNHTLDRALSNLNV